MWLLKPPLERDIKFPCRQGINKQQSNVLDHDTFSLPNVTSLTVQKQTLPGLSFKKLCCSGVPQTTFLIFVVVCLHNKLFSLRWTKLHLSHPPCSLQSYGTSQAIRGYSWYQSWSLFKTRMGSQGFLCQHSCWIITQLHYLWGSPLFQRSLSGLCCLLGAQG